MRAPESESVYAASPAASRKFKRHRNGAQHLRREVSRDGVLGRRHIERDTVARTHAEIGQRLREAADALVPRGIGPALLLEDQRGLVGIALDRLQENGRDIHQT